MAHPYTSLIFQSPIIFGTRGGSLPHILACLGGHGILPIGSFYQLCPWMSSDRMANAKMPKEMKKDRHLKLVGGFFTNPSAKNMQKSKWVHLPQSSGWKFKKYEWNQHLVKVFRNDRRFGGFFEKHLQDAHLAIDRCDPLLGKFFVGKSVICFSCH